MLISYDEGVYVITYCPNIQEACITTACAHFRRLTLKSGFCGLSSFPTGFEVHEVYTTEKPKPKTEAEYHDERRKGGKI